MNGNPSLHPDSGGPFPKPPRMAEPEPATADPEWLIKREFARNPDQGCELLYRRYYENLCSHAIRFVVSKEAAEDIVADVFLAFWKNQVFTQIDTSFGAYLYQAVRNRAYNYLKYELTRAQNTAAPDECGVAHADTPETILHYHELTQRLDAEIQALPLQCRKAFMLSRYEGKRYEAIATELQISQKAVEHLISRALSRLRQHLDGSWLFMALLCSLT